jgi:hypothetical protein
MIEVDQDTAVILSVVFRPDQIFQVYCVIKKTQGQGISVPECGCKSRARLWPLDAIDTPGWVIII